MAYALVSLIGTLEQILHRSYVLDEERVSELQTLLETACEVRTILGRDAAVAQSQQEEMENLEKLIRQEAESAEDILERCITDEIMSKPEDQSVMIYPPDMWPYDEMLEYLGEEINLIMKANHKQDDEASEPAESSMRDPSGNLIVGLRNDMTQIMSRLDNPSPSLNVISIFGRRGSGKKTLARLLYDECSSKERFDVVARATMSSDNDLRGVLENLVDCVVKKPTNFMPHKDTSELRVALHKHLFGKKYLIVLEDVPSCKAWNDVRKFFPDGIEKSRIILTTCKNDVADFVNSVVHKMNHFLNRDECWELIRETVFRDEQCPLELEQVGKIIAKKCEGLLPLEVREVGLRLSMLKRSPEEWLNFAAYSSKSEDAFVGMEKDLHELRGRLTQGSSKLEIIPVVGMGGSGKTTLAKKLFNEFSSVPSHFDERGWATVSQTYNPQGILRAILDCIPGEHKRVQLGSQDLIETLHKVLFGRKYLIVLDDIWSTKAWDDVKDAFQDCNCGSRIIFTTRGQDVAGINWKSHAMSPLNDDDSWKLLRKKVFGEVSCPEELEEVGRTIAKNCGGLPLALQVVGGLLSQAQSGTATWKQVADNVSSFLDKEGEQFKLIFSWSYNNLPHPLKPCFLYMGAFPEDYVIRASKLIKLWLTEGFLHINEGESPEQVAVKNLEALVKRHLIFVRERKGNGDVRSYGIHDLLRDLCMKKAQEENFLYVNSLNSKALQGETGIRRVSVHASHNHIEHAAPVKLTSLVRSYQFIGLATEGILSSLCFDHSLLRMLDVFEVEFREFPKQILQLVNLRFLALRCQDGLPQRISVLKSLQVLIFQILGEGSFAVEVFSMPQIRHVKFRGSLEMKPVSGDGDFVLQKNLQSLSTIPLDILKELLGKVPDLMKLGIDCSGTVDMLDLTCFKKLETIKCSSNLSPDLWPDLPKLTYPDSLQNMTLRQCTVAPENWNSICKLPGLVTLKLQDITMESSTWEPEGNFPKLKFLLLEDLSMEVMIGDSEKTPFHVLEKLVIRRCRDVGEILIGIEEIDTLEMVEVDDCGTTVEEYADDLEEERKRRGSSFKVRVTPSSQ